LTRFTERLLKDIQQPVMRQRPLWIMEPPLSTGERMSVNDPLQTSGLARADVR